MEVLQTTRRSLGDIGVYPLHSVDNFNRFNSKNMTVSTILFVALVSSIMKLLYDCKTMAEYSESIYQVSSMAVACLYNSIIVWKTSNIFNLFNNLDCYIEKRVTDPIKQPIYEDANKSIEKCSSLIYFAVAKFTPTFPIILNICVITVIYFERDLEDEDYVLPFPLWFPFNWKSFPTGYLAACCLEWLFTYYVLHLTACGLILLLGSCLSMKAINKHIQQDIISMDKNWKITQDPKDLKKRFKEIIQNRAKAVQFAGNLWDIYKFLFTICASWAIVTICSSLLMLTNDQNSVPIDFIALLIVKTLYSFGLVFIYCEISERVRGHFEEFSEAIYEMDWYTYRLEIQRIQPMILNHGQKPVELIAYGGISCTRETFKKVVNKGYSFFTVFREI